MEEKEGINIDFYFILWEKYKELYHSSVGVGLPHTVVYRNQYPIAWFFTNKQDQILKKRNVSLNADAIFNHFTTKKQTKSDILGYFIESDPDDCSTKITYFDEHKLRDFLDNVHLRPERGVLQQFIDPVGEHNAMYRANWSERTCMISKKVNRKNLFTKTLDIYERCCTFEGHHIFSDECTVAGGLLPGVIRNCMSRMHLHIFALSHGNSLFKRADGFFKQDATGKIWFLWNNCYRIKLKNYYGQKNYVSNTFFSSKLNMRPLSLEQEIKIPEWVEKGATYDQRRPNQLQKDLLCQNCNELQKHRNFAQISYKYLIFSREIKQKNIEVERREKKNNSLDSSLDEIKQTSKGEGAISSTIARLNSEILNDTKEIDDLIDEINNQRVIVDQNYKITIPEIFQKIHPKMTDYTYQNIKENPKFYSKLFWVCQNCYLNLISYNQLESGCAPQMNYKQIISSQYDYKPKPLRKEFTKFQQECFDLFLEENKYQQAIQQNCTKAINIEDYYQNKKRAFSMKLEEQQKAQKKNIQLQKQYEKRNNEKNLTEEERQMYHLQMLREKQKRISSHIDFVINQAQQNSFSQRPSTTTTVSKNFHQSVHENPANSNSAKGKSSNVHRRSESNIIDGNTTQQQSLEESSLQYNNQYQGFVRARKLSHNPDYLNEFTSFHTTLHESQASVKLKSQLNNINENENQQNLIYENDQVESDQSDIRPIVNNQQNLQIQSLSDNNQVDLQKLQSPKSENGHVVLYQPQRKTPIKQPAFDRKASQTNLNNYKQINQRKRENSSHSKITTINNSETRPVSSERFNTKSSLLETGFLFRSKTPSLSFGNRTLYSVGQSQSQSTNISHRNIDQQLLISPKQSTYSLKELKPSTAQSKLSNPRSASNMKVKKKSFQELYLDNLGQQLSFSQQYLRKKSTDNKDNDQTEDLQNIINHYASIEEQNVKKEERPRTLNCKNSQEDLQRKYKINLNEEIEEYGNNQFIDSQAKQSVEPLNNFKKIQFFPQQNNQIRQYLKTNTKSISQENLHQSSNIKKSKTSFQSNINDYLNNINLNKPVLSNVNKTYQNHLIQDIYKKYTTSTRSNLMPKQIKFKNE